MQREKRWDIMAGGVLGCTLLLITLNTAVTIKPACRIRITEQGLRLIRSEGLRFVAEELENIAIADLSGKEGPFHYSITGVKITDLDLSTASLNFSPEAGLQFEVKNSSIHITFQRNMLYWLIQDVGQINASAHGADIWTVLNLSKSQSGQLKISKLSCTASIARMHAEFTGSFSGFYEVFSSFLTTGLRFLINQQICPALQHSSLVLLNSLLETVPVRTPVDQYVGIDYSLLSDPDVQSDWMDMEFKGMFYPLGNENDTLLNTAIVPLLKGKERMVYFSVSEYFFDSAMYSYYKAGVLKTEIPEKKMSVDLAYLLRTTFFGAIILLTPTSSAKEAPLLLDLEVTSAPRCTIKPSGITVSVSALMNVILLPPNAKPVMLSSIIMESRLNAKVSLKGKKLAIKLDLKRFRMYSSKSTLESLALIPLQTPVKALLQFTVMPIINERTLEGVQIPLPEGIDFINETMKNHMKDTKILEGKGKPEHNEDDPDEWHHDHRWNSTVARLTNSSPSPHSPRTRPPNTTLPAQTLHHTHAPSHRYPHMVRESR
ncbi:phospholipid transfer protein isoform X2 [Scyliorhinus canicula]|uniref:phospholipid transfer protein isoform X2 n=1 Tax=Scyliorhinus canicula TaxID=7830 RepID=UPI0018F3D9AE|nr:phospholipid transfer protein isoform X2 [Scyliorhinus canicula]